LANRLCREAAAPGGEGVQSRHRSVRAAWPAYTAAVWAFVFAAVSVYWAAGGTAGARTIGPAIARPVLAREPGWVALLWGTAGLKALLGLLALALARPWGRRLPRRLLLGLAWAAAAVMGLYEGAASLVQHALMVAGVVGTPEGLGTTAARWHLWLWDPVWLLGGALFALAARQAARRSES
jgi:prepilin signal peptidase PulO-like enzyme (type II secretory pathway)